MHSLEMLWKYHPSLCTVIGFWFFSNLVNTMPSPDEKDGPWYKWAFGLFHSIAGSLPRLVATLAPQYSKLVNWGQDITTKP